MMPFDENYYPGQLEIKERNLRLDVIACTFFIFITTF
jgi:hypothetical protein